MAASPPSPFTCLPTGCNISSVAGPIYWGVAVSTAVFGSNVVLGWTYANNNADKWILRIAIATLFILDGVSTGLNHRFIVQYLLVNFGSLVYLQGAVDPSQAIGYLLTQIIIFIVQIFFATRVYLLRRTHWIVPTIVTVLAVASFAAGLVGNVHEINNATLTATVDSNVSKIAFGVCSALGALCDIVVTGALIWTFHESKTEFRKTNSILRRLVQFTIGRGLLVTVFPICHVSVYLSQYDKLTMNWMPFTLNIGKIYILTMLVMLNSRASIRQGDGVVTTSDMNYRTSTADRSQSTVTQPPLNSLANDSLENELKDYSNGSSTTTVTHNTYDLRDQTKGVYVTREQSTAV